MDERMTELESRFAFHEDTLERLNAVVVRQQRQMDVLQASVEELRRQLRSIQPSLIAHPAEETPPPHY